MQRRSRVQRRLSDPRSRTRKLHRSQFVDPNACNEWIALGEFFGSVKTLRLDDVVAGNGFHVPWQVPGSTLGDLASTIESSLVQLLVGNRCKPGVPLLHDFRGGFFESEMQKHELLHFSLLVASTSPSSARAFAIA